VRSPLHVFALVLELLIRVSEEQQRISGKIFMMLLVLLVLLVVVVVGAKQKALLWCRDKTRRKIHNNEGNGSAIFLMAMAVVLVVACILHQYTVRCEDG
jgi:membrane-anchored protein YejM (alkaline phosphatase superfamily)